MRTYAPRVLARFPVKDHFGNAFDDGAVCAVSRFEYRCCRTCLVSSNCPQLCAPEGVRFTKNLTEPKTLFHSFLITRENASRAHGAVLTYYERVEDPSVVTMLEGMQTHYSGLSGDQDAEQPFHSARDKLFVTKSLCLLSSHPVMKPLQAYLEGLYAVTAGGKAAQLPVESYLFNLLYRVPMPRPGHTIVLSGPLGDISWRRPSLAELPMCDYSFSEFFELLGVKNIVKLLTCLLLEHQVLLKSAGEVWQLRMCCVSMGGMGLSSLMCRLPAPDALCLLLCVATVSLQLAPRLCTHTPCGSGGVLGCSGALPDGPSCGPFSLLQNHSSSA